MHGKWGDMSFMFFYHEYKYYEVEQKKTKKEKSSEILPPILLTPPYTYTVIPTGHSTPSLLF